MGTRYMLSAFSKPSSGPDLDIPKPEAVIKNFWGSLSRDHELVNGDKAEMLDIAPYLEYYCLQWDLTVRHYEGRYVAVNTFDDVAKLTGQLRRGDTREAVLSSLKKNPVPGKADDAYDNSVDLAARLLLMVKIGTVKHQASPQRRLEWTSGSLRDFVKQQFDQPRILETKHVRLPKSFNAWSINMIGGLRIEFTDNLADHLLLVDDDTKILIFHHVSFLECQQQQTSLFPDGLVDETLRTIALLFPQSTFSSRGRRRRGDDKRAWFRKLCTEPQHGTAAVDPRLVLCGVLHAEQRQIEHFDFWRDRLVILKQTHDDATPRTLGQWWHDRRNGERWFAFWVALLVLTVTTFLGLVQCVESALQLYLAYHPSSTPE